MPRDSNNPFASLERLRAQLPPGAPATTSPREPDAPRRAVIRLERKRRGGKEVTVVAQLGLEADVLQRWCRELKQALGCGGAVEDGAIVLQGDLRGRLPALLTARGVARVTVG